MNGLLWMLAGLAAWAVWALRTPCTLTAWASWDERGPRWTVHLYLVDSLFIIRFGFPSRKKRKKRKNRRDARGLRQAVRKEICQKRLLARLSIQARLSVWAGAGDAAATALLCGAIRALAQGAFGVVRAQAREASLLCQVRPDFRRARMRAHFFCMITAKTGNIIAVAAILPLKLLGGKIRHER